MQEVADNVYDLASFLCRITDEGCTSIQCDVSDSPVQSVGMTVSPCDDPPSLQVNVIVDSDTQYIFANGNKTVSLSDIDDTLRISIWHFDYSMDVEVSINP